MRQPIPQQPKVPREYRLHCTHKHNDTALDLYGTLDDSGYTVCDIALMGTNISLYDVTTSELRASLSQWCNDNLPTADELRRESANDARFERELWNRRHL